jgi:hypothetical protein
VKRGITPKRTRWAGNGQICHFQTEISRSWRVYRGFFTLLLALTSGKEKSFLLQEQSVFNNLLLCIGLIGPWGLPEKQFLLISVIFVQFKNYPLF